MMGLDGSGREWPCPGTPGLLGEGTPKPSPGRKAPGRAGEEPANLPRPFHPGAAREPPPPPPPPRGAARAPLGVLRAPMAFLTAWKGAASGKSNRRYQAGRGRGMAGDSRRLEGQLRGHSWRQQYVGCWERQRPQEGQPGASRTPFGPCSQPQQGCGLLIPVALKPHFLPCCNMWATCESSPGELDLAGPRLGRQV